MLTNRQQRKREAGYTLVAVMIGVAIVSMALVGHAMLAGVGALASRKARNDLSCRAAALARLHDVVPMVDGGSLPPAAAERGWSDIVYFDPETGSIVAVGSEPSSDASLVSRQWRRGRDAGGRPVFEVVATAVDGTGFPLAGRLAASVTYSERVR